MAENLTKKQKKFLCHYLKSRNISEAAAACGIPACSAYDEGIKIMKHPQAWEFISNMSVLIKKFGGDCVEESLDRLINAPYEAIRQQRLDVFAVALRAVGAKLAKAVEGAAITALTDSTEEISMNGSEFNYSELAAFWGKFTSCGMNAVVCSPATAAKILAFEEMNKAVTSTVGNMITPFGAEIVVSSSVSDDIVIGMDKTCALEFIRGGEVVIEVDKLISKLSEAAAVAVNAGFSVISADAVKVLKIS